MFRSATSRYGFALFMLSGATSSTLAQGEPAKQGDPSCAVRLLPPDASGDWRKAESDLRQRVRNWPAPDRDCRELSIQVNGAGALLTITTVDGRQAHRQVSKPSELGPAASALAVGVTSVPQPLSFEETRAAEVAAPANATTEERPAMMFFAAGVRLGVPTELAAPLLRMGAALEFRHLELGTFVDWAPHHWALADAPPRFSMWSLSSGWMAGGRQSLGAVDLVGGALLAAHFMHQESTTQRMDDGDLEIDVDEGAGVDLQLGGYVGMASPRSTRVRFRGQVELLLPTSHPGSARELDADLPALPGCWFNAVVGVELGVP